jgi:hypothetical protein
MALVDKIHKGEILFKEAQFSLLTFSFIGDLFLDEECLAENISFEGNYGITGVIELTMEGNIYIELVKDIYYLYYRIKGCDEIYTYNIEKAYFTSGPSSPDTFLNEKYHGSVNSDIVISKKEKLEIDYVICDCICGDFPVLSDNFLIGGRDIHIMQNRNFWNNNKYMKIFKSLLGATIQYKPSAAELDIDKEFCFLNNFELIISFMMGYDFGISICKFINESANSNEIYIIRERKSNCNGSHWIFNNDIEKMRNFAEKSQIMEKIDKMYYKETITSLIKIHNEPDMLIQWSVLIVAFERFLTNILVEKGIKKEELLKDGMNLIRKLNKYNKIIKKIPKKYTVEKIISNYRNPLFHSGEIYAKDIKELFQFFSIYLDLLYALIFENVNYTGEYVLLSDGRGFGKLF